MRLIAGTEFWSLWVIVSLALQMSQVSSGSSTNCPKDAACGAGGPEDRTLPAMCQDGEVPDVSRVRLVQHPQGQDHHSEPAQALKLEGRDMLP